MRTGIGYDVHRLVAGRKLVLGGTDIPSEKGLLGHSDADVLVHAVCDALLGAAGLGDIGAHFPDSEAEYEGIDSRILLRRVRSKIGDLGLRVTNLDLTVVAQAPKLAPHIRAMRIRIAADLKLDPVRVNIKATTTEGMGFPGRGEGIAAYAVVLLEE